MEEENVSSVGYSIGTIRRKLERIQNSLRQQIKAIDEDIEYVRIVDSLYSPKKKGI